MSAVLLAWSLSAAAQGGILSPTATATTANDPIANPEYNALFKRMFANPTDLEVTFRFAEMATQLGDYEAAIGALERMLFFNPDLPRVKLELGVLYFKLGSYTMARSYFESAVKGDNVPAEVRAKVDAFLAEIDSRLSPNKFALYAHAGFRHQTNANAGPDGLLVRVVGQDAVLNSQFAKTPDWNAFAQTEIDYAYDLGDQRGDTIEAIFVGYYADQFKLHQFDLGVAELQVGPRMPIGSAASLKVYGIGNALSLAASPYLYTGGVGASTRIYVAPFGIFEPLIEYRDRTYENSTNYPTASGQSGHIIDAALNMDSTILNVHWVGRLSYDYNRVNDAVNFGFNSYNHLGFDFGLPIPINMPWGGEFRGWIVTPTFGGSNTRYAAADPIVDPNVTRTDREIHFGAIIEGAISQHVGLRVQVQDFVQNSTLPNYDMKNFVVSFGPTVRF